MHFYGARWWDSSLSRFAQADTLISLASQGVQAWDRYAGMNNNPVRYNDPSGHWPSLPGSLNDLLPDALFFSISGTAAWPRLDGSSGFDFYTYSIDVVITNKDVGIFTSPKVDSAATDSNMCVPPDSAFVLPQVSSSILVGPIWGEEFSTQGSAAYEGSFKVIGGAVGDYATEVFSSADQKTGQPTDSAFGLGVGPTVAFGFPVDAHWYSVNSQHVGGFDLYSEENPNPYPRIHR